MRERSRAERAPKLAELARLELDRSKPHGRAAPQRVRDLRDLVDVLDKLAESLGRGVRRELDVVLDVVRDRRISAEVPLDAHADAIELDPRGPGFAEEVVGPQPAIARYSS